MRTGYLFGLPDGIRTHYLQSRSLTLYPNELRADMKGNDVSFYICSRGNNTKLQPSIVIRCSLNENGRKTYNIILRNYGFVKAVFLRRTPSRKSLRLQFRQKRIA